MSNFLDNVVKLATTLFLLAVAALTATFAVCVWLEIIAKL